MPKHRLLAPLHGLVCVTIYFMEIQQKSNAHQLRLQVFKSITKCTKSPQLQRQSHGQLVHILAVSRALGLVLPVDEIHDNVEQRSSSTQICSKPVNIEDNRLILGQPQPLLHHPAKI